MEASSVQAGSRAVAPARREDHEEHPRSRGGDTRLSLHSKLRADLEIERSGDGIEIELEARFRARVDARLGPKDREAEGDGLSRLKASVSARIEVEISAEDTPDGLAAALGQLAEGFSGALDALQQGLASGRGAAPTDLLGGLREAFGGLLAGLRDAFALAEGDGSGDSEPRAEDAEAPPASTTGTPQPAPVGHPPATSPVTAPGDGAVTPEPGSALPASAAAPADARAPESTPPGERTPISRFHHRHGALRRDLEVRFVASLRTLLSRLAGVPARADRPDGAEPHPALRESARLDLRADLRARFVDLRG